MTYKYLRNADLAVSHGHWNERVTRRNLLVLYICCTCWTRV